MSGKMRKTGNEELRVKNEELRKWLAGSNRFLVLRSWFFVKGIGFKSPVTQQLTTHSLYDRATQLQPVDLPGLL